MLQNEKATLTTTRRAATPENPSEVAPEVVVLVLDEEAADPVAVVEEEALEEEEAAFDDDEEEALRRGERGCVSIENLKRSSAKQRKTNLDPLAAVVLLESDDSVVAVFSPTQDVEDPAWMMTDPE